MNSLVKTVVVMAASLLATTVSADSGQDGAVSHGRYLVRTSGCNDCHTPGYAQNDGSIPESEWLTGSAVGWHGEWGTTYPANLRRLFSKMTEQQWLARARLPMRPPMPAPSLRAMSDDDLKAIYHYVRSLEVKGAEAPAWVPPGGKIATPYLDMMPKNLPQVAGK